LRRSWQKSRLLPAATKLLSEKGPQAAFSNELAYMTAVEIPLAGCADEVIRQLAHATGSAAIATLDGATLLGERAMLAGMTIPGRVSAGGGCRLYDAIGDTIALNLSRPADRELLPALFEVDALEANDLQAIAAHIAQRDAQALVMRGRSMGLAIAAEHETRPSTNPCIPLSQAQVATIRKPCPRVIDLSALWAGPLASHLLWLAGAEVIKVESRTRPDAMRDGDSPFHALINQGKASVVLDFNARNDRQALRSLIESADIVIEAARPRALSQLGFDAADIVRSTPGLVWLTITGHGAEGPAADWIGFGDDCGVAGGLSAALRSASGRTGFVGDAIADPLTGMFAASAAWDAWVSRRGGRIGIAMSHVVAHCLAQTRQRDPEGLSKQLLSWSANVGKPFPQVRRRNSAALPAFGEHTHSLISRVATC
jgi:hypothetical protein